MQHLERRSVHNPQKSRRGNFTRVWTSDEVATLKRLWWSNATDEAVLTALPGRSILGCSNKARDLDLPRRTINNGAATDTIWTPEATRILEVRWEEGVSARCIAEELSALSGRPVTRSSVIGKAGRIDLPAHKDASLINSRNKKQILHQGYISVPGKIPDFPDRQHCCFPHGDVGDADFAWCGAEAVSGKPYCDAHCAVAYREVEDA